MITHMHTPNPTPTPLLYTPGHRCLHCHEPITGPAEHSPTEPRYHSECLFRMVTGPAAHHLKLCHCYVPGSTLHDNPTLSIRDNARASLAAYERSSGDTAFSA